jgi:hypothetical protein
MGQGHALLHPRPGARATGLPGAGSVLLIFLMPPNNGMNPTCSSLRSSQAGYAHRYALKLKEACLWNRTPRLRPAVVALEIEQ